MTVVVISKFNLGDRFQILFGLILIFYKLYVIIYEYGEQRWFALRYTFLTTCCDRVSRRSLKRNNERRRDGDEEKYNNNHLTNDST